MKLRGVSEKQAMAWSNYQRMRVRLTALINRELAQETGLSEADFAILTELSGANDEAVRAMALRCGLDWEKSRLSHQIRRMEARGLVRREPCHEDSRGSVIRITEAGRALAAEAEEVYAEVVRRHFLDALTAEQLRALDEISAVVLVNLDCVGEAGAEGCPGSLEAC